MDRIIGFWQTKDDYGIFSNWYHSEFNMDGHHFKNSEQAFMYLKAQLFGDTENMEKILANGNPRIAKNIGREVKPFNSAIFDRHKYEMMVRVNYEKYAQNEEARQILLSTGDLMLAEASPTDRIWGAGLSVDDPDFADPDKWKGQNLLGKALMDVRECLRKDLGQASL